MIARSLAIAAAALRESARGTGTRVGAVLLLLAVPLCLPLVGEAAGRVWISRTMTAEGLRVLLPLAAVVGGAFVLRPGMKQGWALLPVRRSEWFLGTLAAGFVLTIAGVALFVTGAILSAMTLGGAAALTYAEHPVAAGKAGQAGTDFEPDRYLWADPSRNEQIELLLPAPPGQDLEVELAYELIWTQESAPGRGVPFRVSVALTDGSGRVDAAVNAVSRRRAAFTAPAMPHQGRLQVRIVPTDPALIVGIKPVEVYSRMSRAAVAPSVVLLAVAGLAGALLCLAATLLVRSRAGAGTAALAGMLLLAALTLLPGVAPAGKMAADRRAALAGTESTGTDIAATLGQMPELIPSQPFDAFLAGRTVEGVWAASAWRLLAALALLPVGALMFSRRQIAR